MDIIRSTPIAGDGLWEPDLFGFFFRNQGNVCFLYKHRQTIICLEDTKEKPYKIYSGPMYLPEKWIMDEINETIWIMIYKDIFINANTHTVIQNCPRAVKLRLEQKQKPDKFYEEASFVFGDYCISHKGQYGYLCEKNNAKIWDFKGKGYLYTDFYRWKDFLFFGTGGNGGYFYVLDINSGLPFISIKTGGTRCFVHHDNLCFILVNNNKHTKLLCIDLQNGTIVEIATLPGKSTINSRIEYIDNHIHVLTFRYSKDKLIHGIWSCVRLSNS